VELIHHSPQSGLFRISRFLFNFSGDKRHSLKDSGTTVERVSLVDMTANVCFPIVTVAKSFPANFGVLYSFGPMNDSS